MKIDWLGLKIRFLKFIDSITPSLVAQFIRACAVKYGVSLTGIQGYIISLFINWGLKEADKAIDGAIDKAEDEKNEDHYNEVIHDPNSTLQDKIDAETDLLNSRKP